VDFVPTGRSRLPAFLENLSEDGSAVAVLGHDGAVPSSMSELVLTFVDGHARPAGDRHGSAGILTDELQLAARERVYGRSQKQVRLGAEWISGHHLTSMCQVPTAS